VRLYSAIEAVAAGRTLGPAAKGGFSDSVSPAVSPERQPKGREMRNVLISRGFLQLGREFTCLCACSTIRTQRHHRPHGELLQMMAGINMVHVPYRGIPGLPRLDVRNFRTRLRASHGVSQVRLSAPPRHRRIHCDKEGPRLNPRGPHAQRIAEIVSRSSRCRLPARKLS
jgi:hypothetical protein